MIIKDVRPFGYDKKVYTFSASMLENVPFGRELPEDIAQGSKMVIEEDGSEYTYYKRTSVVSAQGMTLETTVEDWVPKDAKVQGVFLTEVGSVKPGIVVTGNTQEAILTEILGLISEDKLILKGVGVDNSETIETTQIIPTEVSPDLKTCLFTVLTNPEYPLFIGVTESIQWVGVPYVDADEKLQKCIITKVSAFVPGVGLQEQINRKTNYIVTTNLYS